VDTWLRHSRPRFVLGRGVIAEGRVPAPPIIQHLDIFEDVLILLPLKLRPPLRHGPEWTEEVDMATESAEPIERWTAKRRVALVIRILKGETSVAEAARQHGLTVAEMEDWREKFLLGAENALRTRPKDNEALKDEQVKKLTQKIGELVLDNDILREALKPYPLDRKTSDA